jgi:hypothetical protein
MFRNMELLHFGKCTLGIFGAGMGCGAEDTAVRDYRLARWRKVSKYTAIVVQAYKKEGRTRDG